MISTTFVILLFTTVAGKICDLRSCRSLTNSDLQNGWDLSGETNDFDLSTIRFVEFTGSLREECSISFKSNNSDGDRLANINVTMGSSSVNISSSYLEERVNKNKTYIVIEEHNFNMDKDIDFTLEYLDQSDDYFLKVYSDYNAKHNFSYGDLHDLQLNTFGRLLDDSIKEYVDTRLIRSEGCNNDLSIYLCPCKNPVKESIQLSGTDLTCTVVSLNNVTIEWRNNIYIQSDTQPLTHNQSDTQSLTHKQGDTQPPTNKQGDTLLYSSTLSNVSLPGTYTCIATVNGNSDLNVTQDYIIPVEQEAVDIITRESGWEKVAIPIIIVVVICVVGGVAVWWYKFRRQGRRGGGGGKKGVGSGRTHPHRGDDTVHPTSQQQPPPPVYTQVSLRGRPGPVPSACDDIYDRLDPNTMTTSRDGWRTLRNHPDLEIGDPQGMLTGDHFTLPSNHHTLSSNNTAFAGNHHTMTSNHPTLMDHPQRTNILLNSNPPIIKPPAPPSIRFALAPADGEVGIYHETIDLNL